MQNKRRSLQNGTERGFVLITALSLMAFILVLLVSMTVLIRVETIAGTTSRSSLEAKEAAKLALMMALGHLQKHAGPDQRVSARAEIAGITNNNRYWTGIWDTSNPSAAPTWLVSGTNPDPSVQNGIQVQNGYDYQSDGLYDSRYDVLPVQVPEITLNSGSTRIAWWISDEGTKAPVKPVPGVFEELKQLEANEPLPDYYDYNEKTLRSAAYLHDAVFDFNQLVAPDESTDRIQKARSKEDFDIITNHLPAGLRERIRSEFLHAATVENFFVVSNTADGGLKKDLSFLKTIDQETITQTQLNALYEDADEVLTPDGVRAFFLNAEPVAGEKDSMMGMRIARNDVTAVNSTTQDFSILPVITEFQLSAGLAADDQTNPGELYLAHKLYLELWNPYTAPFIIGKADLASELGFSDIRVEISNLPNFTITNNTTNETVQGELPNLSYLLSEDSGDQIMRPGMVFFTTLPRDSAGDNNTGVFQAPLNLSLAGTNEDGFTGAFTMAGPVNIRMVAIRSDGEEKEIYQFDLDGYPDFEIDYASDQRATWFRRRTTSTSAQFGMNNESLERLGYAFGFRFKILDAQNSETMVSDLSNWLSLSDPRTRNFTIDLNSWDINSAWLDPSTPPYDFRLSNNDFDPGFFDPSESFKDDDFFYYQTSGSGRRDRIARFFNLATIEPTNLDLLNGVYYPDRRPNPVGNPWGDELNSVYDRYFFSTLPSPSAPDTDLSSKPLLNARLQILDESTTLTGVETAAGLLLKNGFNINSTSQLAWEKVLSGYKIAANELEMQFEQGSYPSAPEWFSINQNLENGLFKFPETAAFNATEREDSPRYEILLRENLSDYENAFRIDSIDWQADRQHPAFIQSVREIQPETPQNLARAVVEQLREFYNNNGRPPFSLAEYINSGILQNAINSVPEINQRANNFDEIPTYAPSNIDQRALLNTLGNLASVRSDTFQIIARAETTDPVSGKLLSSATCRAEVQRIPTEHQNPSFGRQLKITRIEWLIPHSD